MATVGVEVLLDGVLYFLDSAVQKLSVGSHIQDKLVHWLDIPLNNFLQAVVAPIVPVLNAVGQVDTADALMLDSDLDVYDNPVEELPSDNQVVAALRTGSNDELSVLLSFHQVHCWLGADVSVLRVGDPPELRFYVLHHVLLFLLVLPVLYHRFVLLPEVESVLLEVYSRMDGLDYRGEASAHAIVDHFLVSVRAVFVGEIQSHLNFQQLLLFGGLILSEVFLIKGEANNNSLDVGPFLVDSLILLNCFVGLQPDVAKEPVLWNNDIEVILLDAEDLH